MARIDWGLAVAALAAVVFAVPLVFAVYVALIDQSMLLSPQVRLWPLSFDNFVRVWTQYPFPRFFMNSLIVAGSITVGSMLTSIMAAYVIARVAIRGRAVVFGAIVATLMVPGHITLIPNYLTLAGLGLRNTYPALILPFLASGFATFFLRQHFRTVPQAVIDAARIDGAGHWRILWQVVVPMTRPAVAAVAVFVFLSEWNAYIWPLIMIDTPEMRTVEIGLARLFSDEAEGGINDWPLIIAGAVSIMIPPTIIFLLAERHLVRGVTMGSLQ